MRLYRKYLMPPPLQLAPVAEDAPKAILVDLDGTLASMANRSPFEWERVGEDLPRAAVIEAVRRLSAAGLNIIYFSGRDGSCRAETLAWIAEHVGVEGDLFMRAAGDMRKDNIVKKELFFKHIDGAINVIFILDDRDQVVRMWRDELGLDCFQVNYGDF